MTQLSPRLDQLARDALDDIGLVPENGRAAGQSDNHAMSDHGAVAAVSPPESSVVGFGNSEPYIKINHYPLVDDPQSSDLHDYLDAVFRDTEGYAHTFVGIGGYFSRTGSYEFSDRKQTPFEWPAQRDELVKAIRTYGPDHDFYVCPYLMSGKHRRKEDALDLTKVHADCDGQLDLGKVKQLGGFAIGSGTPGHAHVYVELTEPTSLDRHTGLCRALGKFLGDADAKIRPSDLLRPPTTLNHKGRARNRQSTAVEWLVCRSGVRTEPKKLAALLGVDLNEQAPTWNPDNLDDEDSVAFGLGRYPKVEAAIERHTEREDSEGTDRSYDTYRIVAVCKEAGLTIGNARWAVRLRGDLAERLDERAGDDIETVWEKVEGEITNDGLTLPPVFWQRPALKRIQQIAYAEMASPDAVLGLILPKLSASVPPTVRIDTGVRRRRIPLNTYGALVGKTGGFKSSAADAVKESVTFTWGDMTDVLRDRLGLSFPTGEDRPHRAYPGTAQGIIENFMGEVEQPAPEGQKGKPKVVRQQVRSNVLLESDEGNWLVKELADVKSKVGEILRELWTGADTGQGNAKSENRRGVRQGEYSFGMTIGFQLKVLGELLKSEDAELGTPQRIVCFWVRRTGPAQ